MHIENRGWSRIRRGRWLSMSLVLGCLTASVSDRLAAQTFSQILQLGSGVGPRLTRTVSESNWNRQLFGVLRGTTGWADVSTNPATIYQFSADPIWSRIVFGKKDSWIRAFTNSGGPGGALRGPQDVAMSGQRRLYIADTQNNRVFFAAFNNEALTPNGSFIVGAPVALAWDGGSSPLTQEHVYVVNQDVSSVEYWVRSTFWSRPWTYGSSGSGTGQFSNPTGICAGHSASSASSSSLFTNSFYVADAGNQRIVWLRRNGNTVTWKRSRSLPEGWTPADCTVDHFGNVYVADRLNSQLVKYDEFLNELDRYGTYGTGATNYNTFANPHAVHVPFGIKTVGGQNVWYGEGRILTAEDWGAWSGGLEHFLGVDIKWATAGGAFTHFATFFLTEHSLLTVEVLNLLGQLVRTVYTNTLFPSLRGRTNSGSSPDPHTAAGRRTASARSTRTFSSTNCAWTRKARHAIRRNSGTWPCCPTTSS